MHKSDFFAVKLIVGKKNYSFIGSLLHFLGLVSQGAQVGLPQCSFSHGVLLVRRAPIVGLALSTIFTLQTFFWPFRESSASCRAFLKAEFGVKRQSTMFSVFVAIFGFGCFFLVVSGFAFGS